jgi:RNA polymerase sigma-54 factor
LKPMFEKDIAYEVNRDTSTISRTVRGKYVQTDFGIYELRSFFTHSVKTETGENVSNVEYRNKLKELISNEDPTNPLTDDELVPLMEQAGYKVARRTVAKYREQLNIPKARLRRKM